MISTEAPHKETWLPIPGYEGIYEASDQGRIRSLDRFVNHGLGNASRKIKGKILKCSPANHGYPAVNLYKDGKASFLCVHRLIALTFMGSCPDGHEVAHNDGNRLNPKASNLRYATRAENMQDAIKHGTAAVGYRSKMAKLSPEQVSAIRNDTRTLKIIAAEYGISRSSVSHVRNEKTYKQ
jgi:hypothetical protein